MKKTRKNVKRYEKLICSQPMIEFVAVEAQERIKNINIDTEEEKQEKLKRRKEEKARINAGLEVPDFDRTQPSVSRAKTNIRRLVYANAWQYFGKNGDPIVPKHLTLTFKENITDLEAANLILKNFIRRFNNVFKDVLIEPLRYLSVIEFQKRGAIHYHMVLFNLPYMNLEQLGQIRELWPTRFTLTGSSRDKDEGKLIAYLIKYISKEAADGRLFGRKRYFSSHPLKQPIRIYDPKIIAKLRILLAPFRKDTGEPITPNYAESMEYERYYLGEGKSIFSLPLDDETRHALELAAKGEVSQSAIELPISHDPTDKFSPDYLPPL